MSHESPTKENNDLKNAVLERLNRENVLPYSKVYLVTQEYVIWGLWVLTVLFGALSVAVVSFASMNTAYALYEATHDTFFTFAVETLPYLWLGVFILMVIIGYLNLRHTKKGYKYPFLAILASSLGFSVVGGILLNAAGTGYYFDTFLGRASNMYLSQEERDLNMWQKPDEGRLVGMFVDEQSNSEKIWFKDIESHLWRLEVGEVRPRDLELLQKGLQVKLIGMVSSSTPGVLHLCGVFPWMFKEPPLLSEFREERQGFMEQMEYQIGRMSPVMLDDEDDEVTDTVSCANLRVVKKLMPELDAN